MPTGLTPSASKAQDDQREVFEQSYPLSANGRVSVSNINGSITVEAWDRNEVKLEATKIAETKEALAEVELKIDSRADSFSVETDYGNWKRDRGDKTWKHSRRLEVQFKLSLPRGAVLDEIETVNGSVTASNFTNMTKISAVNGDVKAANLRGTANLSTVNGDVVADFDQLERTGKLSLSTVNGRVSLLIPSDVNATLKADSLNGEIKNDFGLPVRKGKYVGRDLYGRIGTGEVQIKLESVNGPLSVQRKNDGKSINPSTNLLQQKTKDDADWDNDTSWNPKIDKLNKDIAKSIDDSNRSAADGLRIAQKELVKIGPEIERIRRESLENIKLINQAELKQQISNSIAKQKDAVANLRNIKWMRGSTFIEKKSNSFPVKGMPKVSIEAKGCSVKVRGWDKAEVKYVLTEVESNRNRQPVTVAETATDSIVNLKVVNNERASRDMFFNGDSDSIRIEVFVPRRSNLKIISNGEIRLDGVSGEIDLTGVDESIDVRNTDGKLQLTAADGQVRIIGFNGDLRSRTADGDVYLEGNFTSITADSGEGNFILTVPKNYNADVSANVDALTVEDLPVPELVREGQWRFGTGGPKYTFNVTYGEVTFRNADNLVNTQ